MSWTWLRYRYFYRAHGNKNLFLFSILLFIGIVYGENWCRSRAKGIQANEWTNSHIALKEMRNWNERDLLGKCAKYSHCAWLNYETKYCSCCRVPLLVLFASNIYTILATLTLTFFFNHIECMVEFLHLTCQRKSAKTHVKYVLYAAYTVYTHAQSLHSNDNRTARAREREREQKRDEFILRSQCNAMQC